MRGVGYKFLGTTSMRLWRRLDVRLFASYVLVALVVFAALAVTVRIVAPARFDDDVKSIAGSETADERRVAHRARRLTQLVAVDRAGREPRRGRDRVVARRPPDRPSRARSARRDPPAGERALRRTGRRAGRARARRARARRQPAGGRARDDRAAPGPARLGGRARDAHAADDDRGLCRRDARWRVRAERRGARRSRRGGVPVAAARFGPHRALPRRRRCDRAPPAGRRPRRPRHGQRRALAARSSTRRA